MEERLQRSQTEGGNKVEEEEEEGVSLIVFNDYVKVLASAREDLYVITYFRNIYQIY